MTKYVVAAILLSIAFCWGLLLLYAIHNLFQFGGWYLVGLLVELAVVLALMLVYWALGVAVWKGHYGDER